jgi:hypothetical protein
MTLNYFFWWLLEPVAFLTFLCAILFSIRKGTRIFRFKELAVYFFIMLALAVSVNILFAHENSFLYSAMYLSTGIGLGYYFILLLESKTKKRIALLMCVSVCAYYLYKQILLTGESLFPSMGFVITSLEVIILIFLYFHQMMSNVKEESPLSTMDFWFICSQIIYHLGAFGIFLTYNYLTARIMGNDNYSYANRSLLANLWGAHNILLLISGLIMWFGVIWILKKKKIENYKEIKSETYY